MIEPTGSTAGHSHPLQRTHDPVSPGHVHAMELLDAKDEALRKTFQDVVGKTLFSQLLASMHKTHDKAAYLHGGRAEEIFQQQLDQVFVDELSDASASQISDPMFELFQLNRR